jgi:hypothetical protein
MLATTDVVCALLIEDALMPSLWIVAAALVGALNVRLVSPGIAALLGVGKWSDGSARRRRLTS